MNRADQWQAVRQHQGFWDVVIIGGGATGLACGMDAASRGYRTLLLEGHDFAKGTSSRSTKLLHGGVRYLQQGDVALVTEALEERGLLMQNAPHLVRHQAFIVPSYEWWNGPFYGMGMKVYDMLAGRLGIKPSRTLSRQETLERIPTLEPDRLRGGVLYYDGQFDDSRLAVNMAQTIVDEGGVALNYVQVTGLVKNGIGRIEAVDVEDTLTGETARLHARVVVNATGIFTDHIMTMDDPAHRPLIQCSQGVHIVLDKDFLPGDAAIMIPDTEDGRVLFAVPWHGRVILGTTDTPVAEPQLEPRPRAAELDFLLRHARQYLSKDPQIADIRSVFAGLRPLVKSDRNEDTAEISRSHHLVTSDAGLVTITGGKWTTCRRMAENAIDMAVQVARLSPRACRTSQLRIHGWLAHADPLAPLAGYGADRPGLEALISENPDLGTPLHADLPYLKAEVVWAVRHEQAMTAEDVLARRTRALLLDARASMAIAEAVARLMAGELGRNEAWVQAQAAACHVLAQGYLPD